MSVHPVLLSALLADQVVLSRQDLMELHALGDGNLVGALPTEVSLPQTSTRMGLHRSPQGLLAAGISLDMVCWPLRKKRLALGATHLDAGRDKANDIMLLHPSVGRKHARFTLGREGVSVQEAGSANGTTVDDVPLAPGEPRLLAEGANIRLGEMSLTYFSTDRLLELLSAH